MLNPYRRWRFHELETKRYRIQLDASRDGVFRLDDDADVTVQPAGDGTAVFTVVRGGEVQEVTRNGLVRRERIGGTVTNSGKLNGVGVVEIDG
jgi:hypothetical protein